MIVLDTDAITFMEYRGGVISEQLRDRLTQLSAENEIVTTIITYEEQTRGWFNTLARARTPKDEVEAYGSLLTHLQTFREIDVLPYTDAADAHFRRFRSMKIRVGSKDLRIAAIAMTKGATILTRNLKDFRAVPGLVVEDWTKS